MEEKYKLAIKGGVIFSTIFILKNILELILGVDKTIILGSVFPVLKLGLGVFISYYFLKKLTLEVINFKNIFSFIFLTWLTAVTISYMFDFMFYNFMFPKLNLELREYSISILEEHSSALNMSEEELNSQIEILKNTNPFSLKNISSSFLLKIPPVAILCSIISLLILIKSKKK